MAGLRARRPGDHRLLRIEEESVLLHHHGQGDLRFARRGRDHPPPHALPSDPADGLRGAGPAVGPSRGALSILVCSRREIPPATLTRAPAFTAGSPRLHFPTGSAGGLLAHRGISLRTG